MLKGNKIKISHKGTSTIIESIVIILSILVLIGWTFNIKVLYQPVSGAVAMNPLTAICFILLSISLILIKSFGKTGYLKNASKILAAVVLTLAVVVLGEIIFDLKFRIDTLLFNSKVVSGAVGKPINFMAPNTALCFLLTSMALLISDKGIGRRWIPSELLALFTGLVAMTTVIGYIYGVREFYSFNKYFPMAISTALSFILITFAIFFSNKNEGFIGLISGSNIGSSMARKLLPPAIILPIMLGSARLYLEHNGLVSDEFGVGLLIMFNMAIFISIIWFYAFELNKKDVIRKLAENITIETSERLQLAAKAGNVGVWELDVVNNQLFWDNQMYNLYGLTAGTFKVDYEAWKNTIHPDDLQRSHNEIQESIHEGKEYSSEFRVIWPDYSIKTIKAHAEVERDKEGRAQRLIGVNWDISDIKKAEKKLQSTLKEVSDYKYALDESAIVAFTDRKGIINRVNDNFCNISKYSREELIGQDHRIVNSGYHSKAFISNLWETISEGKVWKGEIMNKAKDGTFYWVNSTIVPLLNKRGKPYQYIAIRTDISKNKILEEKIKQFNVDLEQKVHYRTETLAARERELSSIFDTVADILFVLDIEKDGHYRFNKVNQAYLKATGLDYKEVVGKRVEDVIPKESVDFAIDKYDEAIKTKGVVRWEEEVDYKIGKLIGDFSISPIIDENNNCTMLIGSIHDLTERKRGEERLKQSESRFRNLFENAPESILVLDIASEKFIKANKTASKLFKFSINELTSMGPVDISPEFQPDGVLSKVKAKKYIEKAMLGKKVAFEWVHIDANKNEIECEVHLAYLSSTSSPQIYASIVDITERKEIRNRLKQQFEDLEIANQLLLKTNNELDRFVYSASHDLRSPLKSLLGLSDMIIEDIKQENTVEVKQMDMMKSSILKLDNFIGDILSYSRNTRTEVAKEAIDFNQTIQDIITGHIYMEGATEIELNVKIKQDFKFVSDLGRINVILNNLFSNAIKYMDPTKENPYVSIDVKCSNDHAIIMIEDNGIGIDKKDKDRIFEMFYRATKTSDGSGLGLYIVKETLEKLNGTINIDSKLTKGTKIIVTLPNRLMGLN